MTHLLSCTLKILYCLLHNSTDVHKQIHTFLKFVTTKKVHYNELLKFVITNFKISFIITNYFFFNCYSGPYHKCKNIKFKIKNMKKYNGLYL